jgi:hypothetical protein
MVFLQPEYKPMREPTFIAAIGMTGVGKTFANLLQVRNVLLGNPQKNVPPRKVLMLDSSNEFRPDNKDIAQILTPYGLRVKTIHYKQVPDFVRQRHVEACRIIPVDDKGRLLAGKEFGDALNFVLQTFQGGLLVCEDFKGISGNSLNERLIGQLTTRRHAGCDTLISMQSINMIQPTLLAVLKWIRLHRSLDPVERASKFTGHQAMFTIAENIVNKKYNEGNTRYFVKIDLQRGAIFGDYNPQEFEEALKQYIFENNSQTIGKRMKWRNDDGTVKYTHKTALASLMSEFTQQYSRHSPRYQSI